MSVKQRGWRGTPMALVLIAAAAGPGRAQTTSFSGGVSSYSLSGTGTTYVFAMRFESRLGSYGIVEPGLAFLSYKPVLGGRTNYLLPEISVQGQAYAGPLRPYVGTGIGFANVTSGPNFNKLTLHLVAGARVRLRGTWGLRLEVRDRSIDPWNGRTTDYTVGISHQTPMGF